MILSQKRLKSTTKSFTTCITPAGSTTMVPSPFIAPAAWVLQASALWPLIFMAQEPHMELRQEQRKVRLPSTSSRTLIKASRTVAFSSNDTEKSSQ